MKKVNWMQVLKIGVKYFQAGIGSVAMLVLGWKVAHLEVSPYIAIVVVAILSIGGYLNANKVQETLNAFIRYFESRNKKGGNDA